MEIGRWRVCPAGPQMKTRAFRWYRAAQESNLPSVGLPRLTGFEGLLTLGPIGYGSGVSAPLPPSEMRSGALRSVQSSVQNRAGHARKWAAGREARRPLT